MEAEAHCALGESGATVTSLDIVLLSHLHVDHTADLAALIKSSFFEARDRELPLFGPGGNDAFPSTTEFIRALFDEQRGAYRYLGSFVDAAAPNPYSTASALYSAATRTALTATWNASPTTPTC